MPLTRGVYHGTTGAIVMRGSGHHRWRDAHHSNISLFRLLHFLRRTGPRTIVYPNRKG